MKITGVRANSRKRVFEVETRKGSFVFPYPEAIPTPTPEDPVVQVVADPEVGREAFTYVLASGQEGTIHIDHVLAYNEDPAYMADMRLHELTVEARRLFDASPLSAREIARRVGTSPAQIYRLLDTTNYSKSMRQMLALIYALGHEVRVEITAPSPRGG